VDKSTPGVTVWEMPADERFANPVGVIQGGILAAMADSAMAATSVTANSGRKVFTANTEMKISFLRPARAEGVHLQRSTRLLRGGGGGRRRRPVGGQGVIDLPAHVEGLTRRQQPPAGDGGVGAWRPLRAWPALRQPS
jgi:uncharacterized protein (TIGR00369 family)